MNAEKNHMDIIESGGIHIEHLLLRCQALTFDATLIDTRICLREK